MIISATQLIPVILEAVDDSATTNLNNKVAINVLENDTAGSAAVISSITNHEHGAAIIFEDSVIYTPGASFTGQESFQYSITANGVEVSAEIVVNVTGTSDSGCFINSACGS